MRWIRKYLIAVGLIATLVIAGEISAAYGICQYYSWNLYLEDLTRSEMKTCMVYFLTHNPPVIKSLRIIDVDELQKEPPTQTVPGERR